MKNLLLISLDCLRADVGYSGQFETINNLCKNGTYFTNAISSAPLTPISHATVLTGLQPYNHGIRHLFKEKVNKNSTTIQQIFKKNGYATAAIVSCPGMNKWYGFGRGFDLYDDEIPKLPDGSDPLLTVDVKLRGTALKRAEIVTDRAINWLEKRDKNIPFVLFVHYFDAHWPYEAPKKYGGKNKYEEEVAYSSHYLGNLLQYMKKNNLIENTTIICFSDHGEDLDGWYKNDKGGKKLGHPEECGHGCLLYEQTLNVLLLINDSTLPKNRKIEKQVRLVDVFPTILELFKFKYTGKLDGQSLVPIIFQKDKEIPAAYSETFFPEELDKKKQDLKNVMPKKSIRIQNKYKVIFEIGTEKIEVYDLKKDPYELNNINNTKK
jgi:arylsulfatase A-like enzyme